MDLTGLVLREGVAARASGHVLAIDGAVWFEPPMARTLPRIHPPRPPAKNEYAVRAHGVDLDRLDRTKRHDGGIVEGWATLTGNWRHGGLHVESQTAPSGRDRRVSWTDPPCRPPEGGWPTVPVHPPMTSANPPVWPPSRDEWPALTITSITCFRPSATQPVSVVAAEDPELAERALRPKLGAGLCVVRSRYSGDEIDSTRQRLHEEMMSHRWPITSFGSSSSADGQPTVHARFVRIEPEVAAWAETVPDGLLDLEVWLSPFRTVD